MMDIARHGAETGERVLDVRGLSVEIDVPAGALHAVTDIDFHVDRGETFCLVGESGCGKTISALSILQLLPRHARLTAERVIFEGQDLLAMKPREFMRVRVRTTSPSNRQAYFEWHRDELTPALREGGITDLRSGRIIMGGNSNTFVRYTFANEFPAQGPDVAAAVGEREFERIISREPDLLVSSEDYVYRYRPELSFTAEE